MAGAACGGSHAGLCLPGVPKWSADTVSMVPTYTCKCSVGYTGPACDACDVAAGFGSVDGAYVWNGCAGEGQGVEGDPLPPLPRAPSVVAFL